MNMYIHVMCACKAKIKGKRLQRTKEKDFKKNDSRKTLKGKRLLKKTKRKDFKEKILRKEFLKKKKKILRKDFLEKTF